MHFQQGAVSLSIHFIGYEFPEVTDREWDSDWLMVNLQLRFPLGRWEETDACLTTFEAQKLLDWFDPVWTHWDFMEGFKVLSFKGDISFMEPGLTFSLRQGARNPPGKVTVTVGLGFEFPELVKEMFKLDDPQEPRLFLTFDLTRQELEAVIISLRSALDSFPVRVGLRPREH